MELEKIEIDYIVDCMRKRVANMDYIQRINPSVSLTREDVEEVEKITEKIIKKLTS